MVLITFNNKTYKLTCAPREYVDQLDMLSDKSLCCLHEEALGSWLPIEHQTITLIMPHLRLRWAHTWLCRAYAFISMRKVNDTYRNFLPWDHQLFISWSKGDNNNRKTDIISENLKEIEVFASLNL